MKHAIPNFLLGCFFIFVIGCESFSTSTYTAQQIKKESEWSSEDQPPTFASCESEPNEDQFSCFKNTLALSINNNLYTQDLIANQEIDDEIVLVLTIDKEGVISLENIENGSYSNEAIPGLSGVIENAVAAIPLAIPAKKANVGVNVATTIRLPIRISATAG